jgi:chaperonin GroES
MAKAKKKASKKLAKKAIKKSAKVSVKKGGPTADRVLIKELVPDTHEKTVSGIIIPVSPEKDAGGNARRGKVVAVGPGKYDDGVLIPMSVSVGNIVMFQWGDKVTIDGEEYWMVRDSEIAYIIS